MIKTYPGRDYGADPPHSAYCRLIDTPFVSSSPLSLELQKSMTLLKPIETSARTTIIAPIEYRPDIDGLRAVAVMCVVFFHAFPSYIPGGFIGVDVFFVISGFLISTILLKKLKNGRVDLKTFYTHRVLRIFPALIVVLITSLLFGWLAMLADEYASLAKHAVASTAFVTNFTLWSDSSYFDAEAETKPLLHLWSLGIEEQFYLAWPLLLFLCTWQKSNLLRLTALLISLSFAWNLYQASSNPIADFYSPLTRLWELLAGAWIALLLNKKNATPLQGSFADAASCMGAALIVAGLVGLSNTTTYPGVSALLPVLGAALIISAGTDAVINRIVLSRPLLVWIGLISYPLYLWHWPLLSFARIVESQIPPGYVRFCALAAAFLLAWATYRLIEKPVRTGKIKQAFVIPALVGGMVSIGLVSALIYANQGFSSRIGANPVEKFSGALGRDPYLADITQRFTVCSDSQLRDLSGLDPVYGYRCFQSKPDSPVEMILIGDSHAEHLLPGLAEQLSDVNIGSLIQSDLPSIDSQSLSQALQFVAHNKDIKTIVISAFWVGKIIATTPDAEKQMKKTFGFLARSNKKIYIMDDIPTFSFNPEKCKYGRRFSFSATHCEMPLQEQLDNKKYYLGILTSALKNFKTITFVPVDQYFCKGETCSMTYAGSLLYRDNNHLNTEGSKYLAKALIQEGVF